MRIWLRTTGCGRYDAGKAGVIPLAWLLALALIAGPASTRAEAPEPLDPFLAGPEVKAGSALIMDAATGTVLWEKNARTRLPMASTTKIMTATLMIESGRLDEEAVYSERASKTEYANLHGYIGERFRMSDLLRAAMMRSSNDACVAAAEHLAGTPWHFARRMTEKAREIGARDTNFVTTNGLYHENHYSTAYDLALITRHAFRHPLFNEAIAERQWTMDRPLNPDHRLVTNRNRFLRRYEGADGVKTGYVGESGPCFVGSATRPEAEGDWRLITVVLDSKDMYGDSARMQDWARAQFQPVFPPSVELFLTPPGWESDAPRFPLTPQSGPVAVIPRRTPLPSPPLP